MQASAAAQKAAREASGEPAPAAKPAAAPAAVAEPPAAEAAVATTPVTPQTPAGSNGAPTNGAAAAAVIVAPTRQPGEPELVEETPEQKVRKEMNRREFLTYAWGAALGLLVLESGVAMYLFMLPRFKAGEFGGKFFVPTSNIPPSDAAPVPYTDGKFWLVQTQENEPKALYMVCTHLGCLYKWAASNNRFECPCHGSKFTHDGFFIEGPAPRSLDYFATAVEGELLVVDTGKKITGAPAAESPAKVVPA
jgi:cytochrome b6-f complex iron-sulfur subunit